MKFPGFMVMIAALAWPAGEARAEASAPRPQVGDTYLITRVQDSVEQGSEGSSGNAHDQDAIAEKVIGVRPDGLELEYDLPPGVTPDQRAGEWQFPVRVFRPDHGSMQLLNGPELEARVDTWLRKGKMTRAACGHWIFTWNAFKIECDPQSAIEIIEAYAPSFPELREGAAYRQAGTRGSAPLIREKSGPQGSTFVAELEIDPDAVRRGEAENDVVVGEIMAKPVTLEAALAERSKEKVSGTVSVRFEADPDGNVFRRTMISRLRTTKADGEAETRTVTETVERRLVSGLGARR